MDVQLSRKIRNLSFLLILMVALIHGYNINLQFQGKTGYSPSYWLIFLESFFSDGLCRIAVPLFYSISGYLCVESLKNTSEKFPMIRVVWKRLHSLLQPYLLVSALGILMVWTLQIFPFSKGFFNHYQIGNTSFQQWMKIWLLSPVPFQLWFIRLLIGYILFFPVLFYVIKFLREVALLVLLAGWAIIPLYHVAGYWKAPFTLGSFLFIILCGEDPARYAELTKIEVEGLFFFALGIYASVFQVRLAIPLNKFRVFLLLLFWWSWIYYRTNLAISSPNEHYLIHYHLIGITISGFLICWCLYDFIAFRLDTSLGFGKISGFSFGVFLFHEPILTILKKALIFLLGQNDLSYLTAYLFSPVLSVGFALIISWLLNKYVSGFYRVLTGNRRLRSADA